MAIPFITDSERVGKKEVPVLADGEDRFETKVLVSVSQQFYGWVTGIGNQVLFVPIFYILQ